MSLPAAPVRLRVVTSHPIQYQVPVWRALEARGDLDLEVWFASDHGLKETRDAEFGRSIRYDVDLLGGYRSRVFPNYGQSSGNGPLRYVNPGIWRELQRGGYDVAFFHGMHYLTHGVGMRLARNAGASVLLRTETYNLGQPEMGLKRHVRDFCYRALTLPTDRVLALGACNRAFYESIGLPAKRIGWAPYVVDDTLFRQSRAALDGQRDRLRAQWGLPPERPVLMFSGKLIPKKQPLRLLEAFLGSAMRQTWSLLIVGEGEQKAVAEQMAAEAPDAVVRFTGFLNQSRLAEAYEAADALVLPSAYQETWGLVVNEALQFGCAIIVSDRVGSGPDLVAGRTGEVFPYHKTEALRAILDRWAQEPGLVRAYQARAAETIAPYTVARQAEAIAQEALRLTRSASW
ncbi:MAG: glycosyltransferase family 4 protein [Verrucomicrobiota bacterium JB022]|nr:glycosyltransferase family 4 protein [Verrucomicrobiota bacterium JB022]